MNLLWFLLIYLIRIFQKKYKYTLIKFYPSDAINAGIATAIKPKAAVAVSNDVLTPSEQLKLLYC